MWGESSSGKRKQRDLILSRVRRRFASVLVAPNSRRTRNSSPNPRRHYTPCTHTFQVNFVLPPPTIDFRPKTAFVWCYQRFDARTRRKLHTAYNPDLAVHTTRRRTPVPASSPPTRRRMCYLYSAGLPTQCLVELQFRDRLCIDTGIVQQPIMPAFRSQVCHLVKLKLRDCLKHRFRSSQLLPNLHLQRR